jgi:hypothetical protein
VTAALKLAPTSPAPKRGRGGDNTAAHTLLINQARLAAGGIRDLVLWPNPVKTLQCVGYGGQLFTVKTGLAIGSSDLVGCLAGRFGGLEGKTGNAQLEPHQRQWHQLVQSKGGFAAVFRSVEEFLAAIERWRRGELC